MAVVPPFITIHAGPHPDLVLGVVPVFPFSQQPSQPEASALSQCVQGSLWPGYVRPVMWRLQCYTHTHRVLLRTSDSLTFNMQCGCYTLVLVHFVMFQIVGPNP